VSWRFRDDSPIGAIRAIAHEVGESVENHSEEAEYADPATALVKQLHTVLADTFTLYTTAHGFHWNVEGKDFSEYHEFFGEIYEDVWGSIDGWAENIRKLGVFAPFRMTDFISSRELGDPPLIEAKPAAMSAYLLDANEKVLECLNEVFEIATVANQQGIANFAADRIDQHQKWSWQLRSSIRD